MHMAVSTNVSRVISASNESHTDALVGLCREAIYEILDQFDDDLSPSDVQLCVYFHRADIIVPICFAAWRGDELVHVTPTDHANVLLDPALDGLVASMARGDFSTLLLTRSLIRGGILYRYTTAGGDHFEMEVCDSEGVTEFFQISGLVREHLRTLRQEDGRGR